MVRGSKPMGTGGLIPRDASSDDRPGTPAAPGANESTRFAETEEARSSARLTRSPGVDDDAASPAKTVPHMLVRRAAALIVEPHESAAFDFDSLLDGGDGLSIRAAWRVYASHLDRIVEVDAASLAALGAISALRWTPVAALRDTIAEDTLRALLDAGLVLRADDASSPARRGDEALRATHWRALSAATHYFSRWEDVDTGDEATLSGYRSMPELREKLGAPPPTVREHGAAAARLALPVAPDTAFDALLRARVTCRNFDPERALPLPAFATMLRRVYGAHAEVAIGDDTSVLKKLTPSGGGLHPTEAYVIAQHVDGIAPGLYHYHPVAHALEPIAAMSRDAVRTFADAALAGQRYFAGAHAIVAMASRFGRSFWKYRDHAKGYRAIVLDVGHLSQTLYLSATELGLGAFVTAAVNEKAIESAFGLDPLVEGPIALSGFGWRARVRVDPEFDPFGVAWPGDDAPR